MLNTLKLGTEKRSLTLVAKILDIFLTVSSASISSQSLGPAKLIFQGIRNSMAADKMLSSCKYHTGTALSQETSCRNPVFTC